MYYALEVSAIITRLNLSSAVLTYSFSEGFLDHDRPKYGVTLIFLLK
jgi:hypothetical protein